MNLHRREQVMMQLLGMRLAGLSQTSYGACVSFLLANDFNGNDSDLLLSDPGQTPISERHLKAHFAIENGFFLSAHLIARSGLPSRGA